MSNSSAINIAIAPSTPRSTKREGELWAAYKTAKNETTTTGLIVYYHGLVISLARARLKCLPDHVTLQDLVAAGMAGLFDAVGKFKESVGVPFKSYASIRIRGAILDWLRVVGPVPRSMVSQKIDYVEVSKFADSLPNGCRNTEDVEADKDEVKVLLARLRKEERRVLQMHFLDGFRLTELAAIYKITESAACFRIKGALAKLREFVRA